MLRQGNDDDFKLSNKSESSEDKVDILHANVFKVHHICNISAQANVYFGVVQTSAQDDGRKEDSEYSNATQGVLK